MKPQIVCQEIISVVTRLKSVLILYHIVLYCSVILSRWSYVYQCYTPMVRYTLLVLNVPLDTNQLTSSVKL